MAEIKSESVADFIPESPADFARNTQARSPAKSSLAAAAPCFFDGFVQPATCVVIASSLPFLRRWTIALCNARPIAARAPARRVRRKLTFSSAQQPEYFGTCQRRRRNSAPVGESGQQSRAAEQIALVRPCAANATGLIARVIECEAEWLALNAPACWRLGWFDKD
jgi:hypothetical protein